jgi:multidrug efflux pump
MKVTEFFIKHPVTAIIINCMIMVMGLLAFKNLEIREYPDVVLPVFTVTTHYPNAAAEVVETNITNVLESALSEVEGLDMITSNSEQGGSFITMYMKSSTDMDKSMALIRDAISKVTHKLPRNLDAPQVTKGSSSGGNIPALSIAFTSESLSGVDLSHYIRLHVKNRLRTIKGIGSLGVLGESYVVEVELDEKQMYSLGINSSDVTRALEQYRSSLPAGKFQDRIQIILDIRPDNIEDIGNILIKEISSQPIYLKDLAKITLKGEEDQFRMRINGLHGALVKINISPDANPLTVSKDVRKELDKIQMHLPNDTKAWVNIDQSNFIRASLNNIKNSMIEAVIFVAIIIFIFLRNVRSILIPLCTVPISLIGTFFVLSAFGYSINTITILALVLAVGLVVDDAIVVLENIYRHLEKGEPIKEAAIKGSREIGFAIVSMTFTLASVYLPLAFIDEVVGQIFVEFAVALASAVIISGVVALTLTPMMCSRMLKSNHKEQHKFINVVIDNYTRFLPKFISKKSLVITVVAAIITLMPIVYQSLPNELAPAEDRGLMGVFIPPIAGKNLDDMEQNTRAINDILKTIPEVSDNYSFFGAWGASYFVPLKDWEQRDNHLSKVKAEVEIALKPLKTMEMMIWSVDSGLPTVNAFETNSNGVALLSTKSYEELFSATSILMPKLTAAGIVSNPYADLQLDNPQISLNINSTLLSKTKILPSDLSNTLLTAFGGQSPIDFNLEGIDYPIKVKNSKMPWSLSELYITSQDGHRISVSSLVDEKKIMVPQYLKHINNFRASKITFEPLPNDSMSETIAKVDSFLEQNKIEDARPAWVGSYKTFLDSSNTMYFLLLLSIIFIYAILAIQFESFVDPLIILITVPLACLGSVVGLWLSSGSINIFSQIAIITLIGLISKHGILIVEFANQLHTSGKTYRQAVLEAAIMRFRPILMTSITMILSAMPLLFSSGAGAELRNSIGQVLVYGLSIGTVLSVILIPSVYLIVKSIKTPKKL